MKISFKRFDPVIVGLTAFQLYAVISDLSQTKPQNNTNTTQLSALGIFLCDGYNAVIESKKSSFISIDNFISSALALGAYLLPEYKKLTNDLHAMQFWKYAGNAVRFQDNLPKPNSKMNWFEKFATEQKTFLQISKKEFPNFLKIHKWLPKLAKNPSLFLQQNKTNFFLVKAWGELLAGCTIVITDLILANRNNTDDNNSKLLQKINDYAWWIVKGLYIVNGFGWIGTATTRGLTMYEKGMYLGLGLTKCVHGAFANNPAIAFTARSAERFFYLTTSKLAKH